MLFCSMNSLPMVYVERSLMLVVRSFLLIMSAWLEGVVSYEYSVTLSVPKRTLVQFHLFFSSKNFLPILIRFYSDEHYSDFSDNSSPIKRLEFAANFGVDLQLIANNF